MGVKTMSKQDNTTKFQSLLSSDDMRRIHNDLLTIFENDTNNIITISQLSSIMFGNYTMDQLEQLQGYAQQRITPSNDDIIIDGISIQQQIYEHIRGYISNRKMQQMNDIEFMNHIGKTYYVVRRDYPADHDYDYVPDESVPWDNDVKSDDENTSSDSDNDSYYNEAAGRHKVY